MKAKAPEPPSALDGHPLPNDLRERFARLIGVIYDFDPLKPQPSILHLAETALRATCRLTPAGWVSMRRYSLNGGAGPSVPLR